MTKGTKSVLFGAHQFLIHPLFVATAWTKLYGFPKDFRLWVAFFVHDIGYIGCANMDDDKGEEHPYLGGRIMKRLFGNSWGGFTLLHSRFVAKRLGENFSRLCVADKLATALEPEWLYLPRAWLSGELKEYMAIANDAFKGKGKYAGERSEPITDARSWFRGLKRWALEWVEANKHLAEPEPRS